jgi:hypothetical protein
MNNTNGLYQLVRIKNHAGRASTVSIDPCLYLQLAQHLRSLPAVKKLIKGYAVEQLEGSGSTLSSRVSAALQLHLDALTAAA